MAFTQSAVLLALCTVLATAAAKEWHGGVVFSNVAKATIASENTKTKVSGGYQSPELRQICLRELKATNCQHYGCLDALACESTGCSACLTGYTFQNELACCKDEDYQAEGAAGDMNPFALRLKVGSCDWTFDLYQGDASIYGANCTRTIMLKNNAEKYGTVCGTCYFNSESESCGHPFCDKMVMSFQGGAYFMQAYTVSDTSRQLPSPDASCGRSDWNKAVQSAVKHSQIAKKLWEKDPTVPDLDRLPSTTTSQRQGPDREYFPGLASLVAGSVTVTSLSHSMDFNRGMLEWVEFFTPIGAPVSTPPAGATPVVPHTMSITLASRRGSYDTYQPRVDESL